MKNAILFQTKIDDLSRLLVQQCNKWSILLQENICNFIHFQPVAELGEQPRRLRSRTFTPNRGLEKNLLHSLWSWWYCVGAIKVLATEPWFKQGSRDEAFEIYTYCSRLRPSPVVAAPPPNLFHTSLTDPCRRHARCDFGQNYRPRIRDDQE